VRSHEKLGPDLYVNDRGIITGFAVLTAV
jgi:hypothetical protein